MCYLSHPCPRSPFPQRLFQGTQPARGADGAYKSSQPQDSPPSPILPEEWPQISKQGLCVVTSKRTDAWHGFQFVKCHYPKRWATLNSLTPDFPPAPSLLGCWHGSQTLSWHRSSVLAWLRKGFWWHPVSARWACFLWPHHGPLRQDWLYQMASPGSPSLESC